MFLFFFRYLRAFKFFGVLKYKNVLIYFLKTLRIGPKLLNVIRMLISVLIFVNFTTCLLLFVGNPLIFHDETWRIVIMDEEAMDQYATALAWTS